MTIDQIFESNMSKKVIWTKKGDNVSKRTVSSLFAITPKTTIEPKKEIKQ